MIPSKKRYLCLVASILVASTTSLTGCWSSGSGSEDENGEGNGLTESDLDAQRDKRFGNGSIPTAEGEGMFHDVHFGYDSYGLEDDARQDLQYNVQVLKQHPELTVTLEGNCDERGTVEYNMALGAERARSVKSALVSMGIPASKLDTISYGEEVPLDPAHNEAAWAKNRRVHFSAGSGHAASATSTSTSSSRSTRGSTQY